MKREVEHYLIVCELEGVEVNRRTLYQFVNIIDDIPVEELTMVHIRKFIYMKAKEMQRLGLDSTFLQDADATIKRFVHWLLSQPEIQLERK